MSTTPPRSTIEYATAPICPDRLEVHRSVDTLRILIPPPAFWRLGVMAMLSGLQTATAGLAVAGLQY